MSILIERKDEKKLTKVDVAKKLESMRARDNELVSGVFRYREHAGGTLRFRFKKYARDAYRAYELKDGERYQLPRMVVRHLNQEVHYKSYQHLSSDPNVYAGMHPGFTQHSADGHLRSVDNMHIVGKVPRCEFISLEFMDDDIGITPNIVQVTRT